MHEAELTRDPRAPGAARRLIADWFGVHLASADLDTARLLTSELVSNAVQHGEGKITLRADLDDNRVLVEVIDEGDGLERALRERHFKGVQGWGLKLVDTESSRWGAHEGTTHVWFELELSGPRLGAEQNPTQPDHPRPQLNRTGATPTSPSGPAMTRPGWGRALDRPRAWVRRQRVGIRRRGRWRRVARRRSRRSRIRDVGATR